MPLTKEEILSVRPKLQAIEVPEWGGSVLIRPLTLDEQARMADRADRNDKALVIAKAKNVMLPLIMWAIVDEEENPLFDKNDVDRLVKTPASALLRLQDEIMRLSGLTKEAREEIEKNLLIPQSEGDT